MDGHRFDDLTKTLAGGGVSRRRVLRGLLGGALGGVLGAAGLRGAATQTVRCDRGEVRCRSESGDYCADLRTDPSNCGRCGRECGGMEVCYAGRCMDTCPSGFTRCRGTCVRACPSNLLPNPETCACECPGDEVLCNGVCRNIASDPNHCGGCVGSGGEVCDVAEGEVCDGENGCCLPESSACTFDDAQDTCCGDLICDIEMVDLVDAGGGIRAFGGIGFGGKCTQCRPNDQECLSGTQCCSGYCFELRLSEDPRVAGGLRALGEPIIPIDPILFGRCANPPGECLDPGETCDFDGDCCSGFCEPISKVCVVDE